MFTGKRDYFRFTEKTINLGVCNFWNSEVLTLQEKFNFMIEEMCITGLTHFICLQEIWLCHLTNMCMMNQIT